MQVRRRGELRRVRRQLVVGRLREETEASTKLPLKQGQGASLVIQGLRVRLTQV